MALNDVKIKAAKPKEKAYKLGDDGGLYLQITPAGGKLWRLKYRFDGKEKTLSFGAYPELSLLQAREKRDEAKKMLAQDIDPGLEKKHAKLKNLTRANLTFEKVASDWMEIKAKQVAPSTYKKIHETFNANVFPRIGHIPIDQIIYEQIRQAILIMQKRGAVHYSQKTRQFIASVFEFAVLDGLIQSNPVKSIDPRLDKSVSQRHPHLKSMEDAGKLLRNLVEYGGNREVAICVYLQTHLAQRPSELRMARWTEFNFVKKLWTLPIERSKSRAHMDEEHTIVLSEQVIAALLELREYSGHSDYLFPSKIRGKVISEATVRKAFRVCFADYHIVPHGCRHFFSTQANEACKHNRFLNFDHDVIEMVLGHKDSNAIRGTYNLATYESSRRTLAQWWSDQLDAAQYGAKVISLHQQSA